MLDGQEPVAVGIAPAETTAGATRWGAPIPTLGMGSTFGIAVQNVSDSGTTCTAFYYSREGMEVARDAFPISAMGIPPGGQVAFLSSNFPANVAPEFVNEDGTVDASVLLTCFNDVIPLILNQIPTNAFPTPIQMFQRPVDEAPSPE
jgi:hypothetical protein